MSRNAALAIGSAVLLVAGLLILAGRSPPHGASRVRTAAEKDLFCASPAQRKPGDVSGRELDLAVTWPDGSPVDRFRVRISEVLGAPPLRGRGVVLAGRAGRLRQELPWSAPWAVDLLEAMDSTGSTQDGLPPPPLIVQDASPVEISWRIEGSIDVLTFDAETGKPVHTPVSYSYANKVPLAQVVSDAGTAELLGLGHQRIGGLPPGVRDVYLVLDVPTEVYRSVETVCASPGEVVSVPLARGVPMMGQVRGLAPGGLTVSVGVHWKPLVDHEAAMASGVCDRDGTFRIPGVPASAKLTIQAWGEGLNRQGLFHRSVLHVWADGHDLVLQPEPAGVIGGSVQRSSPDRTLSKDLYIRILRHNGSIGSQSVEASYVPVGADGRFLRQGVPDGEYQLLLGSEDSLLLARPTTVRAGDSEVELRASSTGLVSGHIAGVPESCSAEVDIWLDGRAILLGSVPVTASGDFECALPLGLKVALVIRNSGTVAVARGVNCPRSDIAMRMSPAHTLKCRVDGMPSRSMLVLRSGLLEETRVLEPGATAVFEELPCGRYTLESRRPNWLTHAATEVVVESDREAVLHVRGD